MAVVEEAQMEVGDFVETDPPVQPEPPLDEVVVNGTGQLSMAVGGKQPSRATLSLAGGKVSLAPGQGFTKGETVVLEVVAVITGDHADDKLDRATGVALECVRAFKAKVTDVRLRED